MSLHKADPPDLGNVLHVSWLRLFYSVHPFVLHLTFRRVFMFHR